MGYYDGGSGFEAKNASSIFKQGDKLVADITDKKFHKERKEKDLQEQIKIQNYNKSLSTAHIDGRFAGKTFTGNNLVVKLEKSDYLILEQGLVTPNPLQFIPVTTPDDPKGMIIKNPLPYNSRGVIIALGEDIVRERQEKNLAPLELGQWVELGWFELKSHRYYPDKNKIDLITLDNPEAPNYEGFALINMRFVESIIHSFEETYGTTVDKFYTKYTQPSGKSTKK
jgi:hypothetical protein